MAAVSPMSSPADTSWPPIIPYGTDASTVPEGYGAAIKSNPALWIRLLIRSRIDDQVLRGVLRAETQLLLGKRTAALSEAREAVRVAASDDESSNPQRKLVAATVLADVACCAAAVDAEDRCIELGIAARAADDLGRVVLAGFLLAVAVYHGRDCFEGRQILHELGLHHPHPMVNEALNSAAARMAHGCVSRAHPPLSTTPLSPVQGGLLNPDPVMLTPSYVHERIEAAAGRHPV
jgi:hypothetical protein